MVDTKSAGKVTSQATNYYGIEPYRLKEGEVYMGPGMKEHFRLLLSAMRDDIMRGATETLQDMRGQGEEGRPADVTDQASLEEQRALLLRTRDREAKLLHKIEKTLDGLVRPDSEYGYCQECGIEIGVGRLEARPMATLCIDCKMLAELREKQRSA
jgi:DnaK suppressor protein